MTAHSPSPKVGWLCGYTPVEILTAAGVQPLRLRGGAGNEAQARAFLPAALCPYLKGCLGDALAGNPEGIDGVVVTTCCDGMRRLADLWSRYLPGFVYVLDVPRHKTREAAGYFRNRLVEQARFLSERYGRTAGGETLSAAIHSWNETRHHLAALDNLRSGDTPISAREMLALLDRATREPPALVNPWLAGLSSRTRGSSSPAGIPVVVSGNLVTAGDGQLLDLIEAAGGRVVGDDLCNGMRGLSGDVIPDADPFLALARSYLERVPCPRMAFSPDRFDALASLCRQREARGVIYVSQKFCDGSLYDFAPLRERLQREGIATLLLELDASAVTVGQTRTRIEAFLEAL